MMVRFGVGLVMGCLVGCGADPAGTADTSVGPTDVVSADLADPEVSAPDASASEVSEPTGLILTIESPVRIPAGRAAPLVVRSEPAYSGVVSLRVGAAVIPVTLYEGRGSASVSVDADAPIEVTTAGVAFAVDSPKLLEVVDVSRSDLLVYGELIVAVGETLTIEAGHRVIFGPLGRIVVHGELIVAGTAAEPVLVTAELPGAWGSIEIRGGNATLGHTWLTRGGGRTERFGGHSASDPVIAVVDGVLSMHGGGIIDNPGKALWSERSRVTLDGVLISRCDTGGEHVSSYVNMTKCHILEIPDADGKFDDDDNDGIYLRLSLEESGVPMESVIEDTVFAVGEDDAIDHNEATVRIERVSIRGFRHEGIAASSGGKVTIRDSVVRGCGQGIEAGYGAPTVVVSQTLVTENGVGLRWGDDYDWEALGSLFIDASMVAGNDRDIRTDDDQQGEVPAGKFGITCSVVGDPAWVGVNHNGIAVWPAGASCPVVEAIDPSCVVAPGPEICR